MYRRRSKVSIRKRWMLKKRSKQGAGPPWASSEALRYPHSRCSFVVFGSFLRVQSSFFFHNFYFIFLFHSRFFKFSFSLSLFSVPFSPLYNYTVSKFLFSDPFFSPLCQSLASFGRFRSRTRSPFRSGEMDRLVVAATRSAAPIQRSRNF